MPKAVTSVLIVNGKWLIVFLFSLLTILYLLFTPRLAHAQNCEPPTTNFSFENVIDQYNKCSIEENVYDDKTFSQNQVWGVGCSIGNLITGYNQCHPETDNVTANSGALAGVSTGIALAFAHPPASGVEYFAQKIQDFNPVQPAYAQNPGIGYRALSPVQPIWTVVRNTAYIGFVIVFIVIGFMVMFRKHISAQAVVTVQDSLPRIIVALVLVTFSYAIAGLMIDLMYLTINLIIALLQTAGLASTDASQIYFKNNIFELIVKGWGDLVSSTSLIIKDALKDLFEDIFGGGGCSPLKLEVKGCVNAGIAWTLGILLGIIIGVALLVMMLKLFFMLLQAYVMIIFLTISAPIFFLIQALPGNNGARGWFKQMLANIVVFPVTVMMFLLAGILAKIGAYGATGANALIDSNTFSAPLLTSGFSGATLGGLIGAGILLMTPKVAELSREFIGAKGPTAGLGGAVMGGIAAGAAASGRMGKAGGNAAMERTGLGQMIGGNIAAWREEPKLRKQADIEQKLGGKYKMPASVSHNTPNTPSRGT